MLIDEIDAHLHIAWQKRIGFWLKEHFPNIQFIVMTHSPFVCQAANREGAHPAPDAGHWQEGPQHVSDAGLSGSIVNGGACTMRR